MSLRKVLFLEKGQKNLGVGFSEEEKI